jgi:hypothetical protein
LKKGHVALAGITGALMWSTLVAAHAADQPTTPVTVNGTQVCVDTGDNSVTTGPLGVTVGPLSTGTQPGSVHPGRLSGCADPTHPPSPPSLPH